MALILVIIWGFHAIKLPYLFNALKVFYKKFLFLFAGWMRVQRLIFALSLLRYAKEKHTRYVYHGHVHSSIGINVGGGDTLLTHQSSQPLHNFP
jgi:hypothetical protein